MKSILAATLFAAVALPAFAGDQFTLSCEQGTERIYEAKFATDGSLVRPISETDMSTVKLKSVACTSGAGGAYLVIGDSLPRFENEGLMIRFIRMIEANGAVFADGNPSS